MKKVGIVISTTDAELAWNAFRLGNFSLGKGDAVSVFLLAKGVEVENLNDPRFNIKEQMETLVKNGGHILACGTCLKIRNSEGTELCPLSTMADLYDLISESDKILSF
ncbi:MAG: DsrE family protein [Flavobacteriales bacterium]